MLYEYMRGGNTINSKEKLKKYNERKLNENDYLNYKYGLINDDERASISNLEVYIYNLMNSGYSYQDKVIKKIGRAHV